MVASPLGPSRSAVSVSLSLSSRVWDAMQSRPPSCSQPFPVPPLRLLQKWRIHMLMTGENQGNAGARSPQSQVSIAWTISHKTLMALPDRVLKGLGQARPSLNLRYAILRGTKVYTCPSSHCPFLSSCHNLITPVWRSAGLAGALLPQEKHRKSPWKRGPCARMSHRSVRLRCP